MLGFDRRALGGATIETPISLFFPFQTPEHRRRTDVDGSAATSNDAPVTVLQVTFIGSLCIFWGGKQKEREDENRRCV